MTDPAGAAIYMLTWLGVYWWDPWHTIYSIHGSYGYMYIWYMMIYDDIWWYMMIYDDIWWYMMIYDDIWWYMMIYDDIWWYMMIYDDICASCELWVWMFRRDGCSGFEIFEVEFYYKFWTVDVIFLGGILHSYSQRIHVWNIYLHWDYAKLL